MKRLWAEPLEGECEGDIGGKKSKGERRGDGEEYDETEDEHEQEVELQ